MHFRSDVSPICVLRGGIMHSDLFRSRSPTLLLLVCALIVIAEGALCDDDVLANGTINDQGGPTSSITTVVEYYHETFDHYFITANPGEIAKLDNRAFGGGRRGGRMCNAYPTASVGNVPSVCRFFSTAFGLKSSHFYTPFP